ncbi:hypothetical protein GW17_00008959 [Ensete ventricosum]|nr:hypothetical protein GW17_00008959 [Ensete ventricosum]
MNQDQVLLSMQQKLDNLCEQMHSLQDQPVKCISGLTLENDQFNAEVKKLQVASQFCGSRTSLLELNPESGSLPFCRHVSSGLHGGKLSALASEQEFYNLRKECEEKDAKIKELAIAVVELTRLRRSSSAALDTSNLQPPVMANNILYDMSSTSPSSSDPDSPMTSKQYHSQRCVTGDNPQHHDLRMAEIISPSSVEHLIPLKKSNDGSLKQQFISPLKENRRIQRSEPVSALRQRRFVHSSEDSKRNRRAAHQKAIYTSSTKRWT